MGELVVQHQVPRRGYCGQDSSVCMVSAIKRQNRPLLPRRFAVRATEIFFKLLKCGIVAAKQPRRARPHNKSLAAIERRQKFALQISVRRNSEVVVGSQINVLRPSEARMRAAYYRRKKLAEEPVLPQLLQNFACGRVVHSSAHSSTVSTMAWAMVLRSPSSIM